MKIIKLLIFSLVSIIIVGCMLDDSTKHTRAAHKFMNSTSKQLEKKFDLKLIGDGGSMMHDIKVIHLAFNSRENLEIDQARKLIMSCAKIFINNMNSSTKIRPYLHNYPATEKNIDLKIFFQIHKKFPPPYVSVVSLHKGNVIYYYDNEEGHLEEALREPYAEALKKIREDR